MSSHRNDLYSLIRNEIILNLNSKLLLHIVTIVSNGLILRYVNLNIIGLANIHYELIFQTILFICRESLRENLPKVKNLYSIYHYINLIWLIIPIGFIFSLFSLVLLLFLKQNNAYRTIEYSNEIYFIYGLSAVIQLLSEPFYLLLRLNGNQTINISLEFFSSIIGLGIQTIFLINNREGGLLYYSIGSMLNSLLLTLIHYIYFLKHKKEDRHRLYLISSLKDLLIKPLSPFVDHRLVNQTFEYLKKGILIKILNDGEKYLIISFSLITNEEQSIYYFICLFGSFFIFEIFSTIEQILLKYFQKISSLKNFNQIDYDQPTTPTEERTIKLNALTLLNHLIRLLIIITFLLIIFLIPHFSPIIDIYFPTNFSNSSSFVLYICLYMLFILLNSINRFYDLFVQSFISNEQLNQSNKYLFFYSLIYLLISYKSIQIFGIVGIIILKILNVIGRIIINRSRIRIISFKTYLLDSHYVFLLLIIFLLLNFNLIENPFGQGFFAFGLILTIICLTIIQEKELIHYIYCVFKLNYQNPTTTFTKLN